MERRNRPKRKKHRFLKALLSIIVVLALVVAGLVFAERYFVKKAADSISAQIASNPEVAAAASNAKIPPATPEQIAQKLNDYADTIVANSAGLLDSARASVSGSTVTYNVASGKLNSLTAGALVAANGDSMQSVADKALNAMSQAGTQNPKVVINLADSSGNTIKSLSYTK